MRRPRQISPVHRRDAGAAARPPAPPRPRLSGDRGGATALEFALVGPVFVASMLFVIEAGWQLTVNLALHIGAAEGSRYAVTGAGLVDGTRDGAVRNKLLSASGGILKSENLTLDAQAFADAADFVSGRQASATAGTSGEFIVYRVRYTQGFITPVAALSRLLSGHDAIPPITHTVTLVAQNEPF